MAVLRTTLSPTAGRPDKVSLQPKTRQFMAQLRNENNFKPEAQVTQRVNQERQEQELQQQERTGDYLESSIKKGQASASQIPELQPGQRVRFADASVVAPQHFQSFYDRLQSITNIAQQQREAEEARSAHRQMRNFQNVLSRSAPQYQGLGQSNKLSINDAVKRSAPLRMLGPVAANAEQAAREISGRYGISNIGGFAKSGHIPGSDHYSGKAIDVMLSGRSGRPVVDYALQNRDRLGVKYIIHNRRFWSPRQGWVRYTGDNPHTGHVHISFR